MAIRTGVRIIVVGDQGTGKSTLIKAASSCDDNFPANVPPVLPPTKLPEDMYRDRVPITVIDTCFCYEESVEIAEELRRADIVVLTFSCDRLETFENLSTYWLPRLRILKVKVPVIVVGCKRDKNEVVRLKTMMPPIVERFPDLEIERSMCCWASKPIEARDVFFHAQRAVLYPLAPLFDKKSHTLKTRFEQALKRIFILCDQDRDGTLNPKEYNNFQVKCFKGGPLQLTEILEIKKAVRKNISRGFNEHGLTLTGFVFLLNPLRKPWCRVNTWTVLRKFGYNDDLKLDVHLPFKRAPDQSVELTVKATDFLKALFDAHDGDGDGMLQPGELEQLFYTAPESLWTISPYKDAVEKNAFGGLSRDAFLSQWAMVTLLNPTFSVETLMYIGYPGDPSSAVHVTRKRSLDRKKKLSERNVLQCFVFGPSKAGKSALLNSFIGRPYSDDTNYNPTIEDRYAVNVTMVNEKKKYLVLREIPESRARELLADKESLASCDIALFVYDRSDILSWRASSKLLVQIAAHGEDTGFQVPCLIIAAKGDMVSFPMALQETDMVIQDMGVEAPIPISVRMGLFNCLFQRIVTAAEYPHLSIPKTDSHNWYHHLLNGLLNLLLLLFQVVVGVVGVILWILVEVTKSADPPQPVPRRQKPAKITARQVDPLKQNEQQYQARSAPSKADRPADIAGLG